MTKPKHKLSRSETEKELKRSLQLSTPLLLSMVAVPVLAFFNVFNVMDEPAEIWFQRSGSLVVLFGLLVEYTLFSINDELFSVGNLKPQEVKLLRKYRIQYASMKYLGLFGAITGTIIWGYGDLVWLALNTAF